MSKIVIDPVTRVSGLLSIEVEIKENKIVDARSSGGQFRGFEKIFENRPPLDIITLAPRICGICSVHHTLAATLALEDALKVAPNYNGVAIREIADGFEFLQNHLRQIYLFAFPDYVRMANINPLFKTEDYGTYDYRLPQDITYKINEDYLKAIKYSREAHKAVAILLGKAPHSHGIFVGGVTVRMDIPQLEFCKYAVRIINDFIINDVIEDIYIIADYYKDYYNKGKGPGNFISYGLFNKEPDEVKYIEPGVKIGKIAEPLDIKYINENIGHSWLKAHSNEIKPGIDKSPEGDPYKEDAYSWAGAARYKRYAMESGPLARMIIGNYYDNGVSVMDRLIARVLESKKICDHIDELLKEVKLGEPYQEQWKIPEKGNGIGLKDASRGALGHWITIEKGKVLNYNIIPPSMWNLGPTDEYGTKGTVEEALIGTEVNNIKNPVEVGRIVRSFDPCLNCAAHVVSDKYEDITIDIV